MFFIEKISALIKVKENISKYGFSYEFNKGLNILCGENSSGKSTILSCIYFALGMEQLLGMQSKKTLLDKCLHSSFEIAEAKYHVKESEVKIVIINSNGEKATLSRTIVSQFNDDKFENIQVETNGVIGSYFLRSPNDHDSEYGFYRWLSCFIGLELPRFSVEESEDKKQLYLQNIFSAAFVEQAKGWTDFYAQMPYFNIKDSKRKLTEFLLSMECLENDFAREELKEKKLVAQKEWSENYQNIHFKFGELPIVIPELVEKYDKSSPDKIKGMQTKIKVDTDWVLLGDYLNRLKIESADAVKKRRAAYDSDPNQIKILKYELLKINSIYRDIVSITQQEEVKNLEYLKTINNLNAEIGMIRDARKIGNLASDMLEFNNCPVCDSVLHEKKELNIDVRDKNFESTLCSLIGQKKLYENYIDKSSRFIEQQIKVTSYYEDKIKLKKYYITQMTKDLRGDPLQESRASILDEYKLKFNIEQIEKILREIELSKKIFSITALKIADIDLDIKELEASFSRDDEKIKRFEMIFKRYLKAFGYSSTKNDYDIHVMNKEPFKTQPCVSVGPGLYQPIRLGSSASDFIRAEWSFYLSLLNISERHPGVLIFDEPGQHAMNTSSMHELCKAASKFGDRQVILAVSKDRKSKDANGEMNPVNIKEITAGIDNINIVDVGTGDTDVKAVRVIN